MEYNLLRTKTDFEPVECYGTKPTGTGSKVRGVHKSRVI